MINGRYYGNFLCIGTFCLTDNNVYASLLWRQSRGSGKKCYIWFWSSADVYTDFQNSFTGRFIKNFPMFLS